MPKFSDRLQHAWNAFRYGESIKYRDYGPGYYYQPNRAIRRIGTERSIVMALYNRIAMDVANIDIKHVQLDKNGRYESDVEDGLNSCFQLEANIDQTSRSFIQDVVLSMLEEGCVAVVPVDTDINPTVSGSYDILSMRAGKVVQWFPEHVSVNLYNEKTGNKEDVYLPKSMVAIIENPFYSVMNEPNSTLQRLIRKLNLLDAIDEQSGSGKLDVIIQLPYTVKSPQQMARAEERRKNIEMQLAGSKYGIAYIDGAEHITQLNRPVENNLMKQIEYLTTLLYSQLGMTEEILKGTADEKTNLNYLNNTIEPIISALCNEFRRKFLTKTARTRGHSIRFFRDPFKLVPIDNIAEIADKFTRNEIMTSNELRQIIGMPPSNDPEADVLRNKNLNKAKGEGIGVGAVTGDFVSSLPQFETVYQNQEYLRQAELLDNLDKQLRELEVGLNHSDTTSFLYHYASPYYDPVKAHEYYEAHKQLKGRRSTAGLNDEGKAASKFVKDRLLAEKKRKIEESRQKRDTGIEASTLNKKTTLETEREAVKNEIAQHNEEMQAQIADIREQLQSMSPAERKSNRDSYNSMIERLRSENSRQREQLNAAYGMTAQSVNEAHKSTTESLREQHKTNTANAKAEYESKLDAEMQKIMGDASFQKQGRRRR